MLMSLYLISSKSVHSDRTDREKEQDEQAVERCIKRLKCPHDGKSFDEMTEDEQHEAYHCRQHRYMKCITAPDPDKVEE